MTVSRVAPRPKDEVACPPGLGYTSALAFAAARFIGLAAGQRT
jgi:hypothetical protein